ncbi:hypothetical protein LPJ61_004118, partial [Coemansia biformis]
FLVGQRKGSHGSGTIGLPGGHLEFGESWERCAEREILEECGVHILRPQHAATTNDIFNDDNKHYVTVFMAAELDVHALDEAGEPQSVRLMEPHKCARWLWITWDELRQRRAVLRDACVEATQAGASFSADGLAATVDLNPVFTPLQNLAEIYGDRLPPWLANPAD